MSLLKVNEVQNYNGSSLTLTASTVSTSAQLNTGGNISVTGSINVSDDSTTRSNLGLGTIATQDSDSITVTGGTATLGALTVSGSDSGDLVRITQTGSGNALVVEDAANPDSTPFVVDSSGNVGIGTDSPKNPDGYNSNFGFLTLQATTGGNDRGALLELVGTGGGAPNYWLGRIGFFSTGNAWPHASITSYTDSAGVNSGSLLFATTTSANSGAPTERMRIDSSGRLLVSPSATAGTYAIRTTGDRYYNRYPLELEDVDPYTAYTGLLIYFKRNGTEVGKIQCTGSSTSYVTSSDYRLKENITEITDGISRIKQLNPSRFNFIVDPDRTVDGFIAHEVSDIVPEAVSGEKDAVNEDGSIRPQGLDLSKLVPLLTAALQESIAKIESLESRIAQLESK